MIVPESQILVDKIIALQRTIAKKQEKNEFMEEHLDTLMMEVKKKNKIIQNYVMNMESGALSTSESDSNKVRYKILIQIVRSRLVDWLIMLVINVRI